MTRKIPCYVLVYDQFSIIKRSIDFLCGYSTRLDIIVIENPSSNTPQISAYIRRQARKGYIKRYYLFDNNIANNAFATVLENDWLSLIRSKHVLITDGDLVCRDQSWLDEELSILERWRVFACGISLSLDNLPLKTFPDAKAWVPAASAETDRYYIGKTGIHLLMMRSFYLLLFMLWRRLTRVHFIDDRMHYFCDHILRMSWARTKKTQASHLTWDLYANNKHPYTRMKSHLDFADIWRTSRESGFSVEKY